MRTIVATPDPDDRPARNRVVSFRLTEQEHAALEQVATASGLTISEFARRRVLPVGSLRLFAAVPSTVTTTLPAPYTITWKAA